VTVSAPIDVKAMSEEATRAEVRKDELDDLNIDVNDDN